LVDALSDETSGRRLKLPTTPKRECPKKSCPEVSSRASDRTAGDTPHILSCGFEGFVSVHGAPIDRFKLKCEESQFIRFCEPFNRSVARDANRSRYHSNVLMSFER
jgi:hypothetical protein